MSDFMSTDLIAMHREIVATVMRRSDFPSARATRIGTRMARWMAMVSLRGTIQRKFR